MRSAGEAYASRREFFWAAGTILLIALINVITASRSPTVWHDEVMFADPAANYVLGNGLTSTAWPRLTDATLWAANAPLHTWLLIPWIKVFGLSPTSVRSINILYVTVAAFLVWWVMRARNLVSTPLFRVAAIVVILFDHDISFSYRSGRYDALGMLLTALCAAVITAPALKLRALWLVLIGLAAPFVSLPMLPYAVAVSVAALIVYGARTLRWSIPVGVGAACGCLLMYAMFRAMGVWQAFMLSVQSFRTTSGAKSGMVGRLENYFFDYATDPLMPLVLMLVVIGSVLAYRHRTILSNRFLLFTLLLLLLVPVTVGFSGRFPGYYLWMVAIPGTVAAFSISEQFGNQRAGLVWVRWTAFALLLCASCAGLPARLAVTARSWPERSYGRVEGFVSQNIEPGDVVYANWQVFYAIARTRAKVYYFDYALTPEERSRVTKLVTDPMEFNDAQRAVGGEWHETAALHSARSSFGAAAYDLRVYERVAPK